MLNNNEVYVKVTENCFKYYFKIDNNFGFSEHESPNNNKIKFKQLYRINNYINE